MVYKSNGKDVANKNVFSYLVNVGNEYATVHCYPETVNLINP